MLALEIFLGARSLGRVWWDRGWVTLRIEDPGERTAFLQRLGGPMSRQDAAEVRFRPEGMTPQAFEAACAAVAAERGLRLTSRPSS